MQLNPARGRKRIKVLLFASIFQGGLCSSTPRGDGNGTWLVTVGATFAIGLCSSTPRGDGNTPKYPSAKCSKHSTRFMQLNPARGRKRIKVLLFASIFQGGLCSSTPRGDGNGTWLVTVGATFAIGLCSSTPRGDGNTPKYPSAKCSKHSTRFMQLNPARGRKLGLKLLHARQGT